MQPLSTATGIDRAALDQYVACPYCDLLHRVVPMDRHKVARCSRCNSTLYRGGALQLDKILAWTLTSLVLLFISNSFPVLSISAAGRAGEVTFVQAVAVFVDRDMWLLALTLFLTSIGVPLFRIASLLLITAMAWGRRLRPGRLAWLLRWNTEVAPWGMLEIYLLGLLVALVKLRDIAMVVPGTAFYAFFLLIFSLAVTSTLLDPFQLWRLVESAETPEGGA